MANTTAEQLSPGQRIIVDGGDIFGKSAEVTVIGVGDPYRGKIEISVLYMLDNEVGIYREMYVDTSRGFATLGD